jgi:DOPA 4,5-dioxygenase
MEYLRNQLDFLALAWASPGRWFWPDRKFQPEMKMSEIPSPIGEIAAYHCHIYFQPETRHIAVRLNEELQDRFKIWDYRWLDETNGLHPTAMFRFAFPKDDFQAFVEWILREREGLSVLVHAITGDDYVDHSYLTLWLGKQLELGLDRMKAVRDARLAAGEALDSRVLVTATAIEEAGKVRYQPGDDPYRGVIGASQPLGWGERTA